MTVQMSKQITKALFEYDRTRARDEGARYVCGADEVGHGCWAGPLVVAVSPLLADRRRMLGRAVALMRREAVTRVLLVQSAQDTHGATGADS